MRECESMLAELNDEFGKLMEIVRGDPEMLKEWNNRNRSEGAYQRHKDDFERKVAAIIAERNRNGSYAARWGIGCDSSAPIS